MKKICFPAWLSLVLCVGSHAQVNRIEYFFNNDPGYGQGTPVSFTSGTNISNLNFTINIASLAAGPNRFYVRSKDANGRWSQTAHWLFYKIIPASPIADNITRIEYYFNTDPGFGSGTSIAYAPGSDINNLGFTPDISSLSAGPNRLFVRSKDANGKWSQTAHWLFYKIASATAPLPDITKLEYYFNTDPGIGNATQVPITAAADISNFGFTPNISSLNTGANRLFIRSKDANGKWSQTANWLFYKMPVTNNTKAPINRMEYFINTDPGTGNAVPLVFNAADSIVNFIFPVNISTLTAGQHFLFIRCRDTLGKWSLAAFDTLNITTTLPAPAIIVNSFMADTTTGSGNQPATAFTLCAGKKIKLAYDPSGLFSLGNKFEAQVSDENGSFASPVKIGEITSTKADVIICTLPRHLIPGSNYKLRVVSNSPVIAGDPTIDVISINDINLGADTTVYQSCFGETNNLTGLYNTSGLIALWNTGNPVAAPPGSYQLIATANYGCPDTAIANIVLEVATWTGAVSNDWHTAANWNINKVPTNKTHVIVNGVTPNICIISNTNAEAASIQVKNGGELRAINNRAALVSGKCLTLPPN